MYLPPKIYRKSLIRNTSNGGRWRPMEISFLSFINILTTLNVNIFQGAYIPMWKSLTFSINTLHADCHFEKALEIIRIWKYSYDEMLKIQSDFKFSKLLILAIIHSLS